MHVFGGIFLPVILLIGQGQSAGGSHGYTLQHPFLKENGLSILLDRGIHSILSFEVVVC